MHRYRSSGLCALLAAALGFFSAAAPAQTPPTLTGNDPLTGDITLIRDPAIAQQGGRWYIVSTDDALLNPADGSLPIHCSSDRMHWQACGHVFAALPAWVRIMVPDAAGLWAPDLSFFAGTWHLYYTASRLGSQVSVIGLATTPTLDQSSPDYAWTDHGPVLASRLGDPFNALDPNIILDSKGVPWLNYGSFWSGIRQRPIDSSTGLLQAGGATYDLAASPDTADHAIEAASMLRHGNDYYLFASTGRCCEADLARDDYNIIVGRSHSLHGPFVDAQGHRMMQGGGTVVLTGGARWVAPGSATVFTDPVTHRDLLVFHALDREHQGRGTLWLLPVTWEKGWPQLQMPTQ